MTPLKNFVQTSEAQLWARNYEWLPYRITRPGESPLSPTEIVFEEFWVGKESSMGE
jgi:hypothetical protein